MLRLLIQFWTILIVFSAISIFIGKSSFMPGSIKKFISNALLLENSYNGAWWYLFTYVCIVLISPLILPRITKHNSWVYVGIGFAIYVIAYYVRFRVDTDNWFLIKFGPFGMTFFEYILGALCYKVKIFTKLYKIWRKIPEFFQGMAAFAALITMLFARTLIVPSLFVAPITGFIIIVLFHFWRKPSMVQRLFLYLGNHSTNIWLIHMFFYLSLFENFVYVVKYPILIYGFMMAITLLFSSALLPIESKAIKIAKLDN